jgi:hypothetical protein
MVTSNEKVHTAQYIFCSLLLKSIFKTDILIIVITIEPPLWGIIKHEFQYLPFQKKALDQSKIKNDK